MSMEPPIVDQAVLDDLKVSVGGDTSFVAELAQAYLSEGDGHIAQISAGLAGGDVAAMVRPAHTLKSSSAALGAARLAEICRSIEHAARDGQVDGLDVLVAEAKAAWLETVAAMTELGLAARDVGGGRLVVDDSSVNRMLLSRHLASIGIDAREAVDGKSALTQLREAGSDVAVVLLDVMMPEMDGYETLAALKSDEAIRHLPVIMISAVDELDSVARCLEMGAADYLPKPFNPTILAARVRASLADKRLRDVELAHSEAQAMLLETIERQKSELARFLSPQVAALVSSPEGEQMLAGHRREATAVFCDLRGFTAFSDSAEPEEVLGLLREYHAMMGVQIMSTAATLEHFAGDGMMVFFNDPVLQADHVARAVLMAVAMRTKFTELAGRWSKLGYDLGLGIGIATGYATLGRIGFEGRYDYGMVGAAVIVASRLSSAAEANQILLNPRAHAAVEELVDADTVGELQLKGFSRPIPTMNVVAARGDGTVRRS